MRRVESCYYFVTYNHRLYSKAQTGSSPTSRRSRQLSPTLNRAPVLTAIKDCANRSRRAAHSLHDCAEGMLTSAPRGLDVAEPVQGGPRCKRACVVRLAHVTREAARAQRDRQAGERGRGRKIEQAEAHRCVGARAAASTVLRQLLQLRQQYFGLGVFFTRRFRDAQARKVGAAAHFVSL